jgi:uncharacterized membrane protein YkgB
MSFETNNYDEYPNYDMDEQSQKGSKAMATTSMVLGIISLVVCLCFLLSVPLGIASLILGIIVLATKRNGKSFAIAGIVTSALSLITTVVLIVVMSPYIEYGMKLSSDPQAIVTMIEDYENDGTIPQEVLDIFGGDESTAKEFMDGFVQSYGETYGVDTTNE